ncbi:hypothetical protein BO71DRAFT_26457 [Aspergillus ellipticus CBS 707.79]|uniref:Uncharacterized protein n=1 Tax=Aspergillus ellipticus CBS 707.79 TaxID=1448320 RepID=A0A319DW30_9EURO|nr:hypothetical protein BO71DRAFT_26457 [Aspergillus ellipticus CBS 707.79]
MGNPKLYVAFYRPRYGNYQHWALYIDDDKESIIFEVTGQHPNFQRNVVYARPDASRSYVSNVYVATLRDDDIADVKEAARQVRVDNDTVDWDCQDYVLELLDKLEDEFILEENDEDYREARKELKKRRGAIL